MARYEHLPIYKKAMELAVYLQNVVRNFSRYDKYSIGADLRDLSRRSLMLIIRANNAVNKTDVLRELVECCEMLKTMLFFAKEVKAFANFKSFQHAASLAVVVSKQSEGWLKSSKNGRNSESVAPQPVQERAHTHCAPSPP
ncbi:MAG: four helix bundle protein [Desulfobulbaceae bacterium]|nr:four helix bundle protein [Desulfobulbaceae bacterium]